MLFYSILIYSIRVCGKPDNFGAISSDVALCQPCLTNTFIDRSSYQPLRGIAWYFLTVTEVDRTTKWCVNHSTAHILGECALAC